MTHSKYSLTLLIGLLICPILHGQKDAPEKIPKYEVSYVFPTEDGIKEDLNRVRVYYESTSTLSIIDSETGDEITDFSKSNKNAKVSDGSQANGPIPMA